MLSSGSKGRMLNDKGACHKPPEIIPKGPRGECAERKAQTRQTIHDTDLNKTPRPNESVISM